ncbi:hydroxyisourate hydrolase [Cellulomonas sp. URHD0024]|uniref:hydroxyisourate hydrolase n=1 Tax=Cellulomonas sp. URHD0024 TaxID=1302620 RepID=UPI000402A064|nr:hydroxyisourate hydrolase [Cellulomonas sp. URHD0024]
MSQLTTHVLDIALGRPAVGVPVVLSGRVEGEWMLVGSGTTDDDGRARSLAPASVPVGTYRFVFDTAAYFASTDRASFLPEVVVVFDVVDSSHYHVPVLLSPFAYSTYRGS